MVYEQIGIYAGISPKQLYKHLEAGMGTKVRGENPIRLRPYDPKNKMAWCLSSVFTVSAVVLGLLSAVGFVAIGGCSGPIMCVAASAAFVGLVITNVVEHRRLNRKMSSEEVQKTIQGLIQGIKQDMSNVEGAYKIHQSKSRQSTQWQFERYKLLDSIKNYLQNIVNKLPNPKILFEQSIDLNDNTCLLESPKTILVDSSSVVDREKKL